MISVMNRGTARTLYNKKDAFGVKHDTEKRTKRSRIVSDAIATNSVIKT